MQQYPNNIELKEPSFLAIKLPVLLLIINLFVFQSIFHLSTATLISVAEQQNLFSFEGLSQFTVDMWFVVTLFCIGLFAYSKLKKQSDLLLVLFMTIPVLFILLSLMRDANSLIVIVLASVIAFLICRFNYQKLSAKYLAEEARKHEGIH